MPASTMALTTLYVYGSNFSTSGGQLVFTDPNNNTYSSNEYPGRVVSVTSTEWADQINNGGTAGTWQVQVVNADGQVSNIATFTVTSAAAPPPSISSVSPTTMAASTTALTTLYVYGSNFSTTGGHLVFTDPDNNTYSSNEYPGRIVAVTSTEWADQINNGGTVGLWQVQVVNADGQVSNSYYFTVY
jgi:hypothetical protein